MYNFRVHPVSTPMPIIHRGTVLFDVKKLLLLPLMEEALLYNATCMLLMVEGKHACRVRRIEHSVYKKRYAPSFH